MNEQSMYVSVNVTDDWPPLERRTLFLFSHFAQGLRPDDAQVHCVPFLTWNPGLLCESVDRAPAASSGYLSYRIAVTLVNMSTKTIPARFPHRFGVQLGP